MKKKRILHIIKMVLLLIVLLFTLIPQINPLLTSEMKIKVVQELTKYFGFNPEDSELFKNLLPKLISIVGIIVLIYLSTKVLCLVIEKVCSRRKRSQTVATLIVSLVKTISAILAIIWILSILGVNIVAIFASLGVISLIVGFGVQSLIEDCVTGIFIIIEGEYNIGDIIVLDDFRGTVVRISIRTTTIMDDGGNLKIINNSDIRNIQNRSNAISVAVCDISISYSESIEKVEKIIADNLEKIYQDNTDVFNAKPNYSGIQELGSSAVVMRLTVKTTEANVFAARRRLNRELKLLFDAHKIEIPFNQIVVHQE